MIGVEIAEDKIDEWFGDLFLRLAFDAAGTRSGPGHRSEINVIATIQLWDGDAVSDVAAQGVRAGVYDVTVRAGVYDVADPK